MLHIMPWPRLRLKPRLTFNESESIKLRPIPRLTWQEQNQDCHSLVLGLCSSIAITV